MKDGWASQHLPLTPPGYNRPYKALIRPSVPSKGFIRPSEGLLYPESPPALGTIRVAYPGSSLDFASRRKVSALDMVLPNCATSGLRLFEGHTYQRKQLRTWLWLNLHRIKATVSSDKISPL